MANDAIIAALGDSDLQNFRNAIGGSSIYGSLGSGISQVGQAYNQAFSKSPLASFGTSLVSSLLGGLVSQYGKHQEAQQLNSVIGVLPQLYSNPQEVNAPEGVDENAFAALKTSSIIKDLQRKAVVQEATREKNEDLGTKILVAGLQSNNPRERSKLLGLAESLGIGKDLLSKAQGELRPQVTDALNSPAALPGTAPTPAASNELFPNLPGVTSLKDRYNSLINDAIENQGATYASARQAAKDQVGAEMKALNGSVDEAAEARKYAQKLQDVADTANAGMAGAGATGGMFGPARNALAYVASAFGNEDQTNKLASQTLLDSVKPSVVGLAKTPGTGATSDFESKMYLGAGPGSNNTPEANALLTAKAKNLASVNFQYADFLDAYKAEKGTTQGAQKLWQVYKQANPIFDPKTGEINSNRPSWQDFAQAGGFTGAPSAAAISASPLAPSSPQGGGSGAVPSVGSTFNGEKVVSVRKVG